MMNFIIKRIYEKPSKNDGYRILIDKIWPRGIKKEEARLDEWNKDVAPSTELRKWFSHKDDHFEEFAELYKKELQDKKEALQHIHNIARTEKVCLLYGAKNKTVNHAIVLKEVLQNL